MASKKRERMRIHERDGVAVVDIGDMEIWDGADLALLRETLTRLIEEENRPAIGVELSYVKYIPSGFFGMLFDWHDRGVSAWLYSPQPNVMRMLWFRRFFVHVTSDAFRLTDDVEQQERDQELELWPDTEDVTADEDAFALDAGQAEQQDVYSEDQSQTVSITRG